jgi:DNA-binding NtrC family response regulator
MGDSPNVLIIDDEESIRDSMTQVLGREGYGVKTAVTGQDGLSQFTAGRFQVVFLDLKLPGLKGLDVLDRLREASPETPVVVITGYASIDSAVEAMKRGAFDYMAKPFTPEEVRVICRKALDSRRLYSGRADLRRRPEAKAQFEMVVGKSRAIQALLDVIWRVSPAETTVLITVESGTGKELIAREIHGHSLRHDGPFVVVDCGALVETLFESELFGHIKGSFTGAHETKHGRFEVADRGTIFFDEIGNISLGIQAKLLRVIQEREITRVGSSKPIKVDVRILAATNEDLAQNVSSGSFREDLFYRLSVVPIHLPALRDRKDDIPLLARHFLQKYAKRARRDIQTISPEAYKALAAYDWPGNIRELENTIERAVVLSRGGGIELDDLMYHGISASSAGIGAVPGRLLSLEEMEKEHIRAVLKSQFGNKSKASAILGIDRKTLWAKIKKFGLE